MTRESPENLRLACDEILASMDAVRLENAGWSETAPSGRRMACDDCDSFFDRYMVWDDVWLSAYPSKDGHLSCLSCLAARLKRPLTLYDFSHYPVNYPIFLGYRMALVEHCKED